MKIHSLSLVLCLALPLCACHSPSPQEPTPELAPERSPKRTVSCTVCDHEGDMACMKVELEADTPTVTLDGTRYYFCSEECRDEFLRNPRRYTD